jgi:hypothetical protein
LLRAMLFSTVLSLALSCAGVPSGPRVIGVLVSCPLTTRNWLLSSFRQRRKPPGAVGSGIGWPVAGSSSNGCRPVLRITGL